MRLPCRSNEQHGRGNGRPGIQEDFRDANTHAAPEKEERHRDEKEISDTHANSFGISEEETFAGH